MPVKIRKWNVAESLYCSPLNTVADAVVAGLAEGVSFKDADFRGVEFDRTDLSGAKFDGADFTGASFYRARCQGTSFAFAQLAGANMRLADFRDADFLNSNTHGVLLDNTLMRGAKFGNPVSGALGSPHVPGLSWDGADVLGATLDDEMLAIPPLTLRGMQWPVLITAGYMRIGCQRHTHAQWEAFTLEEILRMDSKQRAVKFWERAKPGLLALCAQHRANQVEALKALGIPGDLS